MFRLIRLWLLGALLWSGSYISVQAQTATPNPDTVLQDCAKALPPDRPMPTGPNAPSIKILAPPPGSIARGDDRKFVDMEFIVDIQNFDVGDSQQQGEARKHWHLWLNNGVWGMFYQTHGFTGIPYGTWRVCASLGDENHTDIGMPDGMILVVERTGATLFAAPSATPPATSIPTEAVTPTPQAVPISETGSTTPLSPLLMLGAGMLALLTGFALGLRGSRRNG
jgi:hypothetical protein